ncbi:MAG: primosomal protein N' [Spirochaetales bacterium]|nr:primosomal protein N' [Spirochaetales bacterium]
MKYLELVFNLAVDSSFTYSIDEDTPCSIGWRVSAHFGKRKLTGYVISIYDEKPDVPFTIKNIDRVIDSSAIFGDQEIRLARWISKFYLCSLGEALAIQLPGGRRETAVPSVDYDDDISNMAVTASALSESQKKAIEKISDAEHAMYYVYGVTGSGKTEVFLQAADRVIRQGRSVIYLVPEISLTHQLSQQVMNRFNDTVAVLHSSLTPSQRLSEWMKIRSGKVKLVIGARSAVFAPFEHIGMIIIDEEHENSYKSGSNPRYHARQVAFKRAQEHGAVLVMGSATPSAEAWKLMDEGTLIRLHLPDRVSGGALPEIEIIDLTMENGPISPALLASMRNTLSRGKQVILFLNRRGFSYFFHCRTCGYEMKCPHCSVSLTYHRSKNSMICHYCGYRQSPVQVCPECGSLDVGYSGFGTEMIETAVQQYFPDKRIERIDTDTVKKKEYLKNVLADVRSGDVDILLGTQMVAKGLNFKGVELVGIVLADSGLHLPDFRAHERTFSLITQVAGRAGRFSDVGKVIVQTYRPENPAIAHAAVQDLDGFYAEELENRKALGFPPYERMCRFVFRGKNLDRVEKAADSAADILERAAMQAGIVSDSGKQRFDQLGPVECPINRISGNWRYQMIIRSSSVSIIHSLAHYVHKKLKLPSGVYIEIDIDPVALL